MKKSILAAFIAVFFTMFYFTNVSIAEKASYGFSITGQYNFNITSMDGASDIRIEVRPASGGSWVTIAGFGHITSAGTYSKSVSDMQGLFGSGNFLARVNDNAQLNHISQEEAFSIP